MWTIGALSLGVMIIPMYVAVEVLRAGLYTTWVLATFYICTLGIAFMMRYRQGKWKSMRVIEFQQIGVGRCSAAVDVESASFDGKR
jgi:MATE family multidrug resistance protein